MSHITVQRAEISFAMQVESKQRLLDPREMLKVEPFIVKESRYVDGKLTSVIEFQ